MIQKEFWGLNDFFYIKNIDNFYKVELTKSILPPKSRVTKVASSEETYILLEFLSFCFVNV